MLGGRNAKKWTEDGWGDGAMGGMKLHEENGSAALEWVRNMGK